MRSRLSIWSERLGLDGIGVLLFLIVVLAVNLLFFWARSTRAFESLSFGSAGLHAFLEAFPYQWLITGVLAFLAGATLLRASHAEYHPPYRTMVIALVGSAALVGTLSAFAGITERLLAVANQDGEPGSPARAVYKLTEHRSAGNLVGNVVETVPNGFIVQVGHQNVLVVVSGSTQGTKVTTVVPGDRILVVGSAGQQQAIHAAGIRRLPQLPVPRMNWVFHRFPVPVSS